MNNKQVIDEDLSNLICEAAEWRMISLLFDCPTGDWAVEVESLEKEVRDPRLKEGAASALKEASEGQYHSIFGPGGPAPGREVSYRNWVQPGYLISEISSFYSAFSFTPRTLETPDHVSTETGFISYLKLKEAYAKALNDAESAGITADAAKQFTAEHLTKVAEPLAKSLASSGVEYLSIAAETLLKRTGPDKDTKIREFLPVLTDIEDEDFGCGLPT
jgi:nitrate reductase assembly molybdenum cofactor insertion protein NarJ